MHNAAVTQHPAAHEGYVVEVGGRFVSEYGTLTAALRAGLELKNQDAQAQVKVYDVKDRA